MKQMQQLFLISLPLTVLGCFASTNIVKAQVSSDGTLSTTVTPNGPDFTIDNGDRVGGNLFHSFKEFSPRAGSVIFNNALDVQNIINRVTGGSVSDINGLMKAQGSANLFLLNPAGIIFGPNARLEIGGSFFASTAESLLFDGFEFSATNPQALPPTLNINIPIGLRFRDKPETITVKGYGHKLEPTMGASANFNSTNLNNIPGQNALALLEVPAGKTLAFVGGNVTLDSGVLQAPGGQIEIGGLKTQGTVEIKDSTLIFPQGVQRADVTVTKRSGINVITNNNQGGGSITINGRNINISNISIVTAGIGQNVQSVNATAGNIKLNAIESISVTDNSKIDNRTYGQGTAGKIILDAGNSIQIDSGSRANSSLTRIGQGKGGSIEMTTGVFSLTNGAKLFADTDGKGKAGDIVINAERVELVGPDSAIFNRVQQNAVGDGGEIRINTNSFEAKNGAGLFADISGKGDGADVIIDAKERVSFDGRVGNNSSGILSVVQSTGVGNGGDIRIKTKFLELTNEATFNNSLTNNSQGKGGNIEITTGVFSLTNKGQLLADTNGIGNAGNVIINADRVELLGDGSAIFDRVEPNATGNGGEIRITTNSLVAKDGGGVFAYVRGTGAGANVIIDAKERVTFDGRVKNNSSGILSVVQSDGVGNGGDIRVKTKLLELTNGGTLNASSEGNGSPGNIYVDASDRILIQSFSKTNTSAIFSLAEGNIENNISNKLQEIQIKARELSLIENAQINASTAGQNLAGNVKIDTESLSVAGGAKILAGVKRDAQGTAGSITITSKTLTVENPDSGIIVSSQGAGKAGDITIQANSLTLNDRGIIAADTRSTEGGNITLNLRDVLRLRQRSAISTSAEGTQSGGNGGNININVPLIVAFPENNDITANAISGRGGNVRIRAKGLFGISPLSRTELERRLNTTDSSKLKPGDLPTSDITAISQQQPKLDGTVQLNTPDIDPNRGLVELPEEVIDPTQQVAQNPCQRGVGSTFVVTGRSGLPQSPTQALSSRNARISLIEPVASTATSATPSHFTSPSPTPTVQQLIPAQGWVLNSKGKVVLTAYDHTSTGSQRSLRTRTGCIAR